MNLAVWKDISSNLLSILNTITYIFTHFFIHTYIKNTQTTLLKLLYQTTPKHPFTLTVPALHSWISVVDLWFMLLATCLIMFEKNWSSGGPNANRLVYRTGSYTVCEYLQRIKTMVDSTNKFHSCFF